MSNITLRFYQNNIDIGIVKETEYFSIEVVVHTTLKGDREAYELNLASKPTLSDIKLTATYEYQKIDDHTISSGGDEFIYKDVDGEYIKAIDEVIEKSYDEIAEMLGVENRERAYEDRTVEQNERIIQRKSDIEQILRRLEVQ